MLVQVFAGVTQVDQLAGDRQVGEGQSLADEEGPAVEMVFQVIEVRWQLFLQRATHVVLLAGLAHRRLEYPVAEDRQRGQGSDLVVGVFSSQRTAARPAGASPWRFGGSG